MAINSKLITAKASHELITPRKANLVLSAIVGKKAVMTIKELNVLRKRAAEPIVKLIKQAIGNAVSELHVSPDSLIIDSAFATKGRTLKRAHIGGRGRTKPYERVATHLTLNLRVAGGNPAITTPKAVKAKEEVAVVEETVKKTAPKKAVVKKTETK